MTGFRVGAATDTGRVRSNNQDSNLIADRLQLYAVADGMGGHQGGEVASALAVETLEAAPPTEPTSQALVDAVKRANAAVFTRAGEEPALRGMGTTLCAIALVDSETETGATEIAWVNVGDSRVYLYRDGELLQLSTDHNLVEDLRRDGQLTDAEAAVHPQRNIITRALGIDADVKVDTGTVVPYEGDRFLLCSDGLFNEVTLDQITATLRRLAEPKEAADDLVRQANDHGGRDNITCVVVDIVDDDRAEAASAALAGQTAAPPHDGDAPTRAVPAVTGAAAEPDLAGFGAPSPSEEALPFGRSNDDVYDDLNRARTRHLTWRVLAFVLAVLVVLAVAFGAVGWYAKRTYYVAFAGTEVAIYQGQPGGLLFFDPEVQTRTGIERSDLTDAQVQSVRSKQTFASLADARSFANRIRSDLEDRQAASTTTTTTATTTTATTQPTTTTLPTTTTPPTPTSAP